MQYRLGVCTACRAQFRIPATFTAARAKCRSCNGVVEIGPVQDDEGGTAKSPAPAEQKPASAPSAPRSAPPAPAAAAAAPLRSAAAKMASGPAEITPPAPNPAPPRAIRPEPPPNKPAARSTAPEVEKPDRERAQPRRPPPAAKPARGGRRAAILVGVLAVLAAGAFGAWKWIARKNDAARVAGTTQTDAPVGTPSSGAEKSAGDVLASAPNESTAPAGDERIEHVDLTTLPDLLPPAGLPEVEVRRMRDSLSVYLDISAGAKGDASGKELAESGKPAVPILLNAFKRLDFSTDSGLRDGTRIHEVLVRIAGGNPFGWRDAQEPNYIAFDRRVVQQWFDAWERAQHDDAAWAELSRNAGDSPNIDAPPGTDPPKKPDDH